MESRNVEPGKMRPPNVPSMPSHLKGSMIIAEGIEDKGSPGVVYEPSPFSNVFDRIQSSASRTNLDTTPKSNDISDLSGSLLSDSNIRDVAGYVNRLESGAESSKAPKSARADAVYLSPKALVFDADGDPRSAAAAAAGVNTPITATPQKTQLTTPSLEVLRDKFSNRFKLVPKGGEADRDDGGEIQAANSAELQEAARIEQEAEEMRLRLEREAEERSKRQAKVAEQVQHDDGPAAEEVSSSVDGSGSGPPAQAWARDAVEREWAGGETQPLPDEEEEEKAGVDSIERAALSDEPVESDEGEAMQELGQTEQEKESGTTSEALQDDYGEARQPVTYSDLPERPREIVGLSRHFVDFGLVTLSSTQTEALTITSIYDMAIELTCELDSPSDAMSAAGDEVGFAFGSSQVAHMTIRPRESVRLDITFVSPKELYDLAGITAEGTIPEYCRLTLKARAASHDGLAMYAHAMAVELRALVGASGLVFESPSLQLDHSYSAADGAEVTMAYQLSMAVDLFSKSAAQFEIRNVAPMTTEVEVKLDDPGLALDFFSLKASADAAATSSSILLRLEKQATLPVVVVFDPTRTDAQPPETLACRLRVTDKLSGSKYDVKAIAAIARDKCALHAAKVHDCGHVTYGAAVSEGLPLSNGGAADLLVHVSPELESMNNCSNPQVVASLLVPADTTQVLRVSLLPGGPGDFGLRLHGTVWQKSLRGTFRDTGSVVQIVVVGTAVVPEWEADKASVDFFDVSYATQSRLASPLALRNLCEVPVTLCCTMVVRRPQSAFQPQQSGSGGGDGEEEEQEAGGALASADLEALPQPYGLHIAAVDSARTKPAASLIATLPPRGSCVIDVTVDVPQLVRRQALLSPGRILADGAEIVHMLRIDTLAEPVSSVQQVVPAGVLSSDAYSVRIALLCPRVQIMEAFQELAFECASHEERQIKVPLRNGGSVPLVLATRTTDENVFSIQPSSLTIPPQSTAAVVVTFAPAGYAGSFKAKCMLVQAYSETVFSLSVFGRSWFSVRGTDPAASALGYAASSQEVSAHVDGVLEARRFTESHAGGPGLPTPPIGGGGDSAPGGLADSTLPYPLQASLGPGGAAPGGAGLGESVVGGRLLEPVAVDVPCVGVLGCSVNGAAEHARLGVRNTDVVPRTYSVFVSEGDVAAGAVPSPFTLVAPRPPWLDLAPGAESAVELSCVAGTMSCTMGFLMLSVDGTQKHYKVPLVSYAGSSRMQLVEPPKTMQLVLGGASGGGAGADTSYSCSVRVTNTGLRAGFCVPFCASDGGVARAVSFSPRGLVLREGESGFLTCVFTPSLAGGDGSAPPSLDLEFVFGDELLRIIWRRAQGSDNARERAAGYLRVLDTYLFGEQDGGAGERSHLEPFEAQRALLDSNAGGVDVVDSFLREEFPARLRREPLTVQLAAGTEEAPQKKPPGAAGSPKMPKARGAAAAAKKAKTGALSRSSRRAASGVTHSTHTDSMVLETGALDTTAGAAVGAASEPAESPAPAAAAAAAVAAAAATPAAFAVGPLQLEVAQLGVPAFLTISNRSTLQALTWRARSGTGFVALSQRSGAVGPGSSENIAVTCAERRPTSLSSGQVFVTIAGFEEMCAVVRLPPSTVVGGMLDASQILASEAHAALPDTADGAGPAQLPQESLFDRSDPDKCPISIQETVLDFGQVHVGTQGVRHLVLENTAGAPARYWLRPQQQQQQQASSPAGLIQDSPFTVASRGAYLDAFCREVVPMTFTPAAASGAEEERIAVEVSVRAGARRTERLFAQHVVLKGVAAAMPLPQPRTYRMKGASRHRGEAVYTTRDELVFPLTFVGCRKTLKLSVCSRSKDRVRVFVTLPPRGPFSCKFPEFVLEPKSYVKLPVAFEPLTAKKQRTRAGKRQAVGGKTYSSLLTLTNALTGQAFSVELQGAATETRLHVRPRRNLLFSRTHAVRHITLCNTTAGAMEWTAAVPAVFGGYFRLRRRGKLARDGTYALKIVCDTSKLLNRSFVTSIHLAVSSDFGTEEQELAVVVKP